MSYPTKQQPTPPRGGFQLFAMDVGRHVGNVWTVSDYHNAWANLSDEDRARWEAQGKKDLERYDQEFKEWESLGGGPWVKRLKEVTDKGVLSSKLVGNEMRKVPTSCKHESVRVMATAVEAFIGTLAMEAFVHAGGEDKKKLTLLDIHKLIHESDARFGFLTGHFEHPSIFGPSGKKKKGKQAVKAAAAAARAASGLPPKEKQEKLIKPVHRPKMEFSNVGKLYEARNPGGAAWDTLEPTAREVYMEQFKAMKEEYRKAEEQWQRDYPQEYDSMMKKREIDRERSRKKKEAVTGTKPPAKEGNGAGSQAAGHESGSLSPMTMMATHQPMMTAQQQAYMQQQQQPQLHYQMQQQMAAQQNQLNFRSVADSSMFAQQQIQQKRIIVDDPTLKGSPWKKVHVLNGYTGQVEDEYYWNTQTNATSWDHPWVK